MTVKHTQFKILNRRIRYLVITAEEIQAEVTSLEKGVKTVNITLIQLMIQETLKTLKWWVWYNFKVERLKTSLTENREMKKTVRSIEDVFMTSFENNNNLIKYIKNDLSVSTSVTVVSWLQQSEVVQWVIIKRLDYIMHNRKQKQRVPIYISVINILQDIEVMTMRSMHNTAVKVLA